ncbi:MAG: metal-dependent transcriptional regulator [bacterium]
MKVWKTFEHNIITHSAAHHLMTIASLLNKNGYARVTDVAKSLEITRGSASITLKALKEKGYVQEDENKFLRLSDKGASLCHSIKSMRIILIKFMKDILNVDTEQAEIDACKIEHLLSAETGDKLLNFLKFLFSEDKRVKAFLNAYWSNENECQGLIEECQVCESECLLNESTHSS